MSDYQYLITREIEEPEVLASIEDIKKNGYCVIKGYCNATSCIKWKDIVEKLIDDLHDQGIKPNPPLGLQSTLAFDRVLNCVFKYDRQALIFLTKGPHLKIFKYFLNDPYYDRNNIEQINFILAQANVRGNVKPLPFHVDTRLLTPGYITWSMQGVLALSQKSSHSGGLRVIPRSHLLDEYPDNSRANLEALNVDLDPGDLAIFSSQLHHATHPHIRGELGWALNMTYRSWWVKQQYDIPRMLSNESIDSLSYPQKVILGLSSQPPSDPLSSPSMRQLFNTPNESAP